MWARAGILVLWVTTACYSPNPASGAPCGPGGACPEGLRCTSENVCSLGGPSDSDAALPPVDGELPGDVPPRTRWAILDSSGKVGSTVGIQATQAGTTMLVGIETSHLASATSVTDDAGNSYELITGSRAINTIVTAGIEVWAARDLKAGATQLTATGTTIRAMVAWEVANLAGDPVAVDTVSEQAASTSPTGVEITTTKPGQFVLSILIVQNQVSGLTAGSAFTNDHGTFGNGWAHLTDDDAPPGTYQPQWNQAMSGSSCATSVVFDTVP